MDEIAAAAGVGLCFGILALAVVIVSHARAETVEGGPKARLVSLGEVLFVLVLFVLCLLAAALGRRVAADAMLIVSALFVIAETWRDRRSARTNGVLVAMVVAGAVIANFAYLALIGY
jgi:hypothetical protein